MSTIALKIDVDTFAGAQRGVPRLLEVLDDLEIRASFFFALGPDNSGKAIWRALRSREFRRKMVRTRALRLYGLRTALSGTLLRARVVSDELGHVLRRARDEGHEIGLHGWDHRRWQDALTLLSEVEIAGELQRAWEAFERVLGERPRAFAAPGWAMDGRALAAVEALELDYTSSTRFGEPFFPEGDGWSARTLEIPSTLPCPEELRRDACPSEILGAAAGTGVTVYPAHAEVEGGVHAAGFRAALERRIESGASFSRLGDVAGTLRSANTEIPRRRLVEAVIPGRAARVSTGFPEVCPRPAPTR